MSAYTVNPGWCRPFEGGWITLSDIDFHVGREGSGLVVSVAAGTRFDVSIPRGLRWLFDPDDPRFLKAAAVHDTLLVRGWDRVTAGAVFHSALKADRVGCVRRRLMWLAVSVHRID